MTNDASRNVVGSGVTDAAEAREKQVGAILILDDDKFLLDMYAVKFQQIGFRVHASLFSQDALKALREGFSPDAILFDLIMPEGDGFTFLETVKKERLAPEAKTIALTNEMSEDEKKRVMDLGADDYIVKATKIPSEVVAVVAEKIAKNSKSR